MTALYHFYPSYLGGNYDFINFQRNTASHASQLLCQSGWENALAAVQILATSVRRAHSLPSENLRPSNVSSSWSYALSTCICGALFRAWAVHIFIAAKILRNIILWVLRYDPDLRTYHSNSRSRQQQHDEIEAAPSQLSVRYVAVRRHSMHITSSCCKLFNVSKILSLVANESQRFWYYLYAY